MVEELFGSALLLEGNLENPHQFVSYVNKMLEQSSDWYTEEKKLD